MQHLLRDLFDSKLSRRGFVAAMVSAGYSAAAAKSALQSASPFVPGTETSPSLTRIVTGTGGELHVSERKCSRIGEQCRGRNPTAAANLDSEIARCIERLADREFDGPVSRLRSGAVVRSWGVPPFRIYYQRHPDELLIVRVYHQARRPITR